MEVREKAQALRKAMKGLGTDDKTLISVVASTTYTERLEIVEEYRKLFKRSLIDDIKGDTSGNYQKLLVSLFQKRELVMANCVYTATAKKLLGTDDDMLIHIVTQFRDLLPAAKEEYRRKFGHEMALDVSKDTSGDYRELLLRVIEFNHAPLASPVANADALYKAGAARLGTDEKVFIDIFGGHTREELREIEKAYDAAHPEKVLADAIDSETSGNFEQTLYALVSDRPTYFCCVLFNALDMLGTKEYMINMIFTLLDREELFKVAVAYYDQYQKSLYDDLRSDLSMNYRTLVLTLLDDKYKGVKK